MKLEISGLRAAYETEPVIHNLSLQVAQGEFLSLLGPSGCGKSTLLKAIAGIVPVSGGTISLDAEDITYRPVHKRGTVVVFQDMRLFPHMSILHNVAFPLKMQGLEKSARLQAARAMLARVQLEGLENRLPEELSGGQQQRAALARALAGKPKLLLLDEPFSALDENLREDMRGLVLQLHREFGMTTILVTHDREEALSMSDRVAVMFAGTIAQTGTPQQVYAQPASRQVADYFGDCVYIPGTVTAGSFSGGGIRCAATVPEGPYTLMLRPDCLAPAEDGDYPLWVVSRCFRGHNTLVTLQGPDGTIWKKVFPPDTSLVPGDRLQARLDLRCPILFPGR